MKINLPFNFPRLDVAVLFSWSFCSCYISLFRKKKKKTEFKKKWHPHVANYKCLQGLLIHLSNMLNVSWWISSSWLNSKMTSIFDRFSKKKVRGGDIWTGRLLMVLLLDDACSMQQQLICKCRPVGRAACLSSQGWPHAAAAAPCSRGQPLL